MIRVINQEHANDRAWDAFVAGNARKDETFTNYARRNNAEARTPPSAEELMAEREAIIDRVRYRLGRLYRPPIQA